MDWLNIFKDFFRSPFHHAGSPFHHAGSPFHHAGSPFHHAGSPFHHAGSPFHHAGSPFHHAGSPFHHAGSPFHHAGSPFHHAGSPFHHAGSPFHHAGSNRVIRIGIGKVKRKPSVPDTASPADDSFVDPGERLYDLNMPAFVKFNYMAEREDELSLIKGTKVIVMEKCSDGWWRGSYNGQIGWFPSNYVTEEGDSPLGDHVGSLSEKLAAVVNNLNTGQVLHVVQALYPFSSSNDEELNFEKGDVMDVIEKPENDPEWWKCRKINGMVGLVPKNYVTIMQNNPLTSGLEPSPPQCDYIRPSLTGKFAGNPWYYGKVTRHQAEMALNERGHEGDFLIRDSESSPNDFSVSLKAQGKNKHFKVQLKETVYCIGQRKFSTMEELVEHYKKAPIFTSEQGEKLYLVKHLS